MDVQKWVANGRKGVWLHPFLGFLAIIPEFTGTFRTWIFVIAAILTVIPIGTTVHQWLRPARLTPLLNMSAGTVFGLMLLLLLVIWNVFSRFPSYSLATEYWPAYVLVALGTLFFALRYAVRRWRITTVDLKAQLNGNRISMDALNQFFFGHPSLAWQQKHWHLLVPAVGLAAVVTPMVIGVGGRNSFWLAFSLMGFPLFLPPLISVVTMRWYTWRYLGDRDIEIVSSPWWAIDN